MKKTVYIQTNKFFVECTPTTQEDNHFGIVGRWDLFSDESTNNKIGSLVEYTNGGFAAMHPNAIRYTFIKDEVGFI